MTAETHRNRLADSSSPYLLLHQHNPVDWYPWGEQALARARREDRPIFLSVGYSTCYWCHVMERESFSDSETAALMNRDFVNIKLDREERPDLDEIYMSATQLLTGQGGWPNSVFLTPRLEPFFAGTYFPPVDRPGLPAFRTVLASMADAWRTRRSEVEEQAESLTRAIRHHLGDRPPPADTVPGRQVAERSLAALGRGFDRRWGGFGGAPKFPTPSNLLLLLERAGEDEDAGEMLSITLDRMARGGVCDQLAGGFHRYATDRQWKIPHFEKMLYDNAWLLEVYARESAREGDPQAARVARSTAAFLRDEMTSSEGALWSALDAETDGHEGAFYVWRRPELVSTLGAEDFAFLAPIFGFDGDAFFEDDAYVLNLPQSLEAQAERRRMSVDELVGQIEPLRRRLLEVRRTRPRPLTDDKILTDWNGMAIAGLATAGRLLGEEGMVQQAEQAAAFIVATLRAEDGSLLHAWRDGRAHQPALLGDYAFLVRGLLALERATEERRWLDAAIELTRQQERLLGDPEGGFFVSQEGDDLLVRSRDLFDGAVPAANGVAVLNLIELEKRDPGGGWVSEAERALRGAGPVVERLPQAARTLSVAVLSFARLGDAVSAAEPPSEGEVSGDEEAVVDLRVEWGEVEKDGERQFRLALEIADGWHVYAAYPDDDAPEWITPLDVTARDGTLGELEWPSAEELPPLLGEDRIRIYQGAVAVAGRLRPTGNTPRIEVGFQACDERSCRAPQVRSFESPRPSP